jgi:hypothetical protein
MKFCIKCNIEKEDIDFESSRNQCKQCMSKYRKIYNKNNKEKIKQQQKEYNKLNKEKLKILRKKYSENNKEAIRLIRKEYKKANKEQISNSGKQYYKLNKTKIRKRQNLNQNKRRKKDPSFGIRSDISRAINKRLKSLSASKNGQSCIKYVPYTIQELKEHLEKQFEPWMNWGNRGKYNSKIWDDNDQSTWTWQIDHIKPHATFHYTSMEDHEFQYCWALSNLRPLSAKQNYLDGVNKTRHTVIKEPD